MTTRDVADRARDVADLLKRSGLNGVHVDGDTVAFPLAGLRYVILKVTVTDGIFDLDTKIADLVKSELSLPCESK